MSDHRSSRETRTATAPVSTCEQPIVIADDDAEQIDSGDSNPAIIVAPREIIDLSASPSLDADEPSLGGGSSSREADDVDYESTRPITSTPTTFAELLAMPNPGEARLLDNGGGIISRCPAARRMMNAARARRLRDAPSERPTLGAASAASAHAALRAFHGLIGCDNPHAPARERSDHTNTSPFSIVPLEHAQVHGVAMLGEYGMIVDSHAARYLETKKVFAPDSAIPDVENLSKRLPVSAVLIVVAGPRTGRRRASTVANPTTTTTHFAVIAPAKPGVPVFGWKAMFGFEVPTRSLEIGNGSAATTQGHHHHHRRPAPGRHGSDEDNDDDDGDEDDDGTGARHRQRRKYDHSEWANDGTIVPRLLPLSAYVDEEEQRIVQMRLRAIMRGDTAAASSTTTTDDHQPSP